MRGRDTDLDSTACWLTADGDEDRSPSMWITCVGVHELVVREENEVTSIRIHPRDPSDIARRTYKCILYDFISVRIIIISHS